MSDDGPKMTFIVGTGAASVRLLQLFGKQVPPEPRDEVTTMPDLTGEHGRAWLCDVRAARRHVGPAAETGDATLAMWLIEAAWAHPVWHSYLIVLVHLRPMADGRKTLVYVPGATHEFWLYALEPSKEDRRPTQRQAFIALPLIGGHPNPLAPRVLNPLNFAAQMICESDDDARDRIKAVVTAVVEGRLSPDTDALSDWGAIFGENMIKPGWRG